MLHKSNYSTSSGYTKSGTHFAAVDKFKIHSYEVCISAVSDNLFFSYKNYDVAKSAVYLGKLPYDIFQNKLSAPLHNTKLQSVKLIWRA